MGCKEISCPENLGLNDSLTFSTFGCKWSSSSLTLFVNKVVKHGAVIIVQLRQVQSKVSVVTYESFQLGPVIQLQKGTNAPHDCEDVEAFVVCGCQLYKVFVIFVWDQSLQQLGCLEQTKPEYPSCVLV